MAPVEVVREYESARGVEPGSLVARREQARSARAAIGRDGTLPAAAPAAAAGVLPASDRDQARTAPTAHVTSVERARWSAGSLRLAIVAAVALLALAVVVVLTGGGAGERDRAPATVAIAMAPGDSVPRCWLMHGTARLDSGRTLVLGVDNLDNDDPNMYFAVVTWTTGQGNGPWTRPVYFGTVPGQRLTVTAYQLRASAVAAIPNKDDATTWVAPQPPPGAVRLTAIQVHRRAGAGDCP